MGNISMKASKEVILTKKS